MKFDTLNTYPYTAEVWKVISQDADTGVIVYAFERLIKCQLTTWRNQTSISTPENLTVWQGVRNIKDRNNVEVNPGAKYQVKDIQPLTNVYGYAEGLLYLLGADRGAG